MELMLDRETGGSRGFGFVEFYNHAAADAARRHLSRPGFRWVVFLLRCLAASEAAWGLNLIVIVLLIAAGACACLRPWLCMH